MAPLVYENASFSPEVDLLAIARHFLRLMLRNVASKGYIFTDPETGSASRPGCIIASPTYPDSLIPYGQIYVYNWTRDSALTAIELASANPPLSQALADYVNFADACQNSGASIGYACFTVDGKQRPGWSEQSDGPALQVSAILQFFAQLAPPVQAMAKNVIAMDMGYLLDAYKAPTVNLWEETEGYSFFTRSVQLRCFREYLNNTVGIPVGRSSDVKNAITDLENALQSHWDPGKGHYLSVLNPQGPGADLNADIIMASIYGAVPHTDSRMLASAAMLRSAFADSGSQWVYPVNEFDNGLGVGPLIGRYPGDTYDADDPEAKIHGHPWAPCSCNLAELYYKLAKDITKNNVMPFDALSSPLFSQVGINSGTPPDLAASLLRTAGDKILHAIIRHSDFLELSEQFEADNGFEKSVHNLTWSYASFLSAIRARQS